MISRHTVRGFDGETMLAAERGFFWRNGRRLKLLNSEYPYGATSSSCLAGSNVHLSSTDLAAPFLRDRLCLAG
ncbi:hemolysin activation/secretion protein [Paraburkholderia sp. CI2]|nr:hemolysin activation/secretion protein [Paraburkholderia sp. CI2]